MDNLHDPHPSELEEVLSSARLAGAETTTDPLYREIRRHMNTVVVDIDTVAKVNTNPSQRRRSQHRSPSFLRIIGDLCWLRRPTAGIAPRRE